jgi:hypothetical protein
MPQVLEKRSAGGGSHMNMNMHKMCFFSSRRTDGPTRDFAVPHPSTHSSTSTSTGLYSQKCFPSVCRRQTASADRQPRPQPAALHVPCLFRLNLPLAAMHAHARLRRRQLQRPSILLKRQLLPAAPTTAPDRHSRPELPADMQHRWRDKDMRRAHAVPDMRSACGDWLHRVHHRVECMLRVQLTAATRCTRHGLPLREHVLSSTVYCRHVHIFRLGCLKWSLQGRRDRL